MRNLSTNGLSLSDAQAISNLIHQNALEIERKINSINCIEKTAKINGEEMITQRGVPIPSDIVELITKKCRLHATQAFLKKALEEKENLLKELKFKKNLFSEEPPLTPEYPEKPLSEELKDEKWGFEQLTAAEYAEYVEMEAYAAHYGNFFHKDTKLAQLREKLATTPTLEWMEGSKENERIPVKVNVLQTSEELLEIHTKFAELHREAEKRVNYFKAKVKNLVSEKNAQITAEYREKFNEWESLYNKLSREYEVKYKEYLNRRESFLTLGEIQRLQDIKQASALRIVVDPRFQATIDEFSKK